MKLLEEIRAVPAYLAALADGEAPPPMTSDPPNLAAFVASLSSAWHAGEVRPTFSIEAKPRYLRSLQKISPRPPVATPALAATPTTPPVTAPMVTKPQEKPQLVYAKDRASAQALHMVWPMVCRRLEGRPNINARQLFEELCLQYPGRFGPKQYRTLLRRVNQWRQDARARGVEIGAKTYRRFSDKSRGHRPCKLRTNGTRWRYALNPTPI